MVIQLVHILHISEHLEITPEVINQAITPAPEVIILEVIITIITTPTLEAAILILIIMLTTYIVKTLIQTAMEISKIVMETNQDHHMVE